MLPPAKSFAKDNRVKLIVFLLAVAGIFVVKNWRDGISQAESMMAPGSTRLETSLSSNDIVMLVSPSKKEMMESSVRAFNAKNPGGVVVEAKSTFDAIHFILEAPGLGKRPGLFSPIYPDCATSADNFFVRVFHMSGLRRDDPNQDFIFAETPIIFLTTEKREKELRKILGGDNPWEAIRKMTRDSVNPSWGRLRFSFCNPEVSSSGLITLGMALRDWKLAQPEMSETKFLKQATAGVVLDAAARQDSEQLIKKYLNELSAPAGSIRDFIAIEESLALKAVQENPNLNLRVIYPLKVASLQHRLCVLNSPWNQGKSLETSRAFALFMRTEEAHQVLTKNYLHPATLNDELLPLIETRRLEGFRMVLPTDKAESPDYNDLMNFSAMWTHLIEPDIPRTNLGTND